MSFKTDLVKGEKWERVFGHNIENRLDRPVSYSEGNFTAWDIEDSEGFTYEVKTDFSKYPNMAIELFCLRRFYSTGLANTKAIYFVYIRPQVGIAYQIESSKLRKYITEWSKKNLIRITNGGDNQASVLAIIPPRLFYVFEKIDI